MIKQNAYKYLNDLCLKNSTIIARNIQITEIRTSLINIGNDNTQQLLEKCRELTKQNINRYGTLYFIEYKQERAISRLVSS